MSVYHEDEGELGLKGVTKNRQLRIGLAVVLHDRWIAWSSFHVHYTCVSTTSVAFLELPSNIVNMSLHRGAH